MKVGGRLIQRDKGTERQRKKKNGIRLLVGLVCGWILLAQIVFAHGGGILRVENQPVGAYAVSVWVNPPVPRSNETLHMTVGIAGADQAPVLDAAVQIDILDIVSGDLITSAPATTEQSVNRLFYETDFPRIEPGSYDVVVRVNGDGGVGEVSFKMEMQPAGMSSWITAVLVIIGVAAFAFVVVSWRRQQRGVGKRPLPPKKAVHNR